MKIHKLKLTTTFPELATALWKVLFEKLGRGPLTQELEGAFKSRFKTRQAVIFPHARTALHFILKAMDLEEGSEILMAPLTIADMVNSIHTLGLKPVFVDIELGAFCMDPESLRKAITPKSKAILVTYLFGVVPDVAAIRKIAQEHDLKIIEDCSQCLDGTYDRKPVGTFGDAAFFSLTNFKICTSLFGGMVITDDDRLADRLRDFRHDQLFAPRADILIKLLVKNLIYTIFFAPWIFSYFTYFIIRLLEEIDPRITYRLYSGNIKVILGQSQNKLLPRFPEYYLSDYSDVQARIGLRTLSRAQEANGHRIRNGRRLVELLRDCDSIKIPAKLDKAGNVYWRLPVISQDRNGLKKFLLKHGIDSAQIFLTLCSDEPGFEPYHASMPNSEYLKRHALVVETHEDLGPHDMERTATLVKAYYADEGHL